MTDVIIIGGGPAGVSAALTAMHRNKSAAIVSSAPEDSALYKAELIDNYPGFPEISGQELLKRLLSHAESSGAQLIRGRALSVMPMGGSFGVSVGADFFECRAVVLAAGLTRMKPYPGEKELLGAGVSYCATCDGMLYRGRRVAVVGLSADAPEEAEYLRSIGCQVEYFDIARAKKYQIRGNEKVEALVADGREYPAEAVFILRPGLAPGDLIPGVELQNGHIRVDGDMAATVPGVFACGDCVGAPYQIAKAVGEGNIAGLSASKYVENLNKEE